MDGIAALVRRIAEMERRISRMMLQGTVTDVDAAKHRVRLQIGGTDEKPHKSPWIAYGQIAGALKVHSVPSQGQQMLVIAPDGVPEAGLAIPLTWSDANPSPSDKPDEHVMTFGQVKVTIKGAEIKAEVGGASFTMTPAEIKSQLGGSSNTITSDKIADKADQIHHNE